MLNSQRHLSTPFYLLLSLPATAMGFALSVQIATLSWILSTQFNLEIYQIGFVWAAGPLAGIVGQVLVGLISDKVWFWRGRRRPFILIGGSLAALMLAALPNLAQLQSMLGMMDIVIVALFVALTLDLAINISFNPTRTLIADVTPQGEQRTKGYTWMQTISGFFGVLAYLIGASWGNIELIYLSVFVVLAFSLLPTLLITEPRQLHHSSDEDKPLPRAKAADWPQLIKLYVAHGFSWLGVQSMFVYFIFYLNDRLVPLGYDNTGQLIGYSFAILNTVGFIVPALVLLPLSRRFGRVPVHAGCMALMAIGYFAMVPMVSSPVSLYLLMAVVGIGWGSVVSLPFAIMSEKADPARMGFFMGIFNLSVVLPQLVVSMLFGLLLNQFADKAVLFVLCGSCLALSALCWCLVRENASSVVVTQAPASH
ncbi:MFS transporter [Arsukibacterium sp.]|uniref:MFS transporter n=1 Tax=Arsukibacterium sp. TaxID=1977258 RepID=UPI002FDB11B5